MRSFKNTFWLTFIIGIAGVSGFWGGYLVRDQQIIEGDLPILMEARELLLKHGYQDVPADPALEYGMIRGMIQAYNDPYTSFSEPAQHELSTNNLEGRFGGIGAQLEKDANGNFILLPLPNHPASNAGVIEGDRLIKVDELEITPETTMDTILAALRGKVDTVVNISITRPPDFKKYDFRIKRADISLPSVISYLAPIDNRLGVVKVNIMAATTPDEIEKAVLDLQQRGAQAFALDLRDNFGGLLDSGVDTARLFLASGEIMRQKYKGESVKTYSVISEGPLSELPIVILVNQNTASAAEITAGALQKQQRAMLIGTHTYGKDSVQLVFELRDKSSLQVTAARWWVPDENSEVPESIAGVGLQPDIPVDLSGTNGPDPAIQAAIETLFTTP